MNRLLYSFYERFPTPTHHQNIHSCVLLRRLSEKHRLQLELIQKSYAFLRNEFLQPLMMKT